MNTLLAKPSKHWQANITMDATENKQSAWGRGMFSGAMPQRRKTTSTYESLGVLGPHNNASTEKHGTKNITIANHNMKLCRAFA
jgi:hypothetical protein